MKAVGMVCCLAALCAFGEEKPGAVIFSDGFESTGTFAENWKGERASSVSEAVRMKTSGWLSARAATPIEFVCDVEVTLDPQWGAKPADGKRGWGGILIEQRYHFAVKPDGTTFLVWRLPDEKRSQGRYLKISGYQSGVPVHLRVVRTALGDCVRYAYYVNGMASGDFIAPMPQPETVDGVETFSPPRLFSYREDVQFDSFQLARPQGGNDSPNMVYNSGFEHGEDGVPTFYGLHGKCDFSGRPWNEYETRYLKRFRQDGTERHSGRYSLRVEVNDISQEIVIAPWQTGTVKGRPGVFSVWMKASVDALPVEISYAPSGPDGRRTVSVGREWRRYEVTRTELPGKGTYTPVRIVPKDCERQNAVLWLDDLQAEVVPMPDGGKFDPAKTYATPYRPSELDKDRFDAAEPDRTPSAIKANLLPAGVKPSLDFDAWTEHAFCTTDFRMCGIPAKRYTAAYVACDSDNLYLGFRNCGEDAKQIGHHRSPRDSMVCARDSLELFFKPTDGSDYYHLMAGSNGDQFDIYANNLGWNGKWTVEARENAKAGSVDYLITLPFADFAENGFSPRWSVNLCRNDYHAAGVADYLATGWHKRLAFKNVDAWNAMDIPLEVASKWMGRSRTKSGSGEVKPLGRLDFYMDEPEVAWRVAGADGKVDVVRKPMSEVPYGTNLVTFTHGGRTYSDTVVRLPYRKGASQVNRWTRSVMHDGRNELFLGPCIGVVSQIDAGVRKDANPYPQIFDLLKNSGFRHFQVMVMSRSRHLDEARRCLDAARERGLIMMNWCDYGMCNYNDDLKWEVKRKVNDMTYTVCRDFFEPYGNILGHLVIDEPELYKTSEWTRRWLDTLKPMYPYSPVVMNNTVMGIPSRFADLKTDILMLDDYLTNGEGRTVDSIVSQVDVMGAVEGGKPCWFFIVSDNMTLHHRNPTYAEQVAQSWGCICAGCSGLVWYIGMPNTEGTWRAMVDVNREAQQLAPVILSEELCEAAACSHPKKKIRHITRTLGGKWHVLSCNIDATPQNGVTFALPEGAPRTGEVEVLFENRTIRLADGKFTDDYPAHMRHLYRIRGE